MSIINDAQAHFNRNVVDDLSAPQLYSELSVWGVSVGLTPFFGSVLMAMNLKRIGKSKGIYAVLAFGILWYALMLFVLPEKPLTFVVFLLNMLGGSVLLYFWPKLIGKDLKYRTRPTWIPLIIAVLIIITGFFVYFIVTQ